MFVREFMHSMPLLNEVVKHFDYFVSLKAHYKLHIIINISIWIWFRCYAEYDIWVQFVTSDE